MKDESKIFDSSLSVLLRLLSPFGLWLLIGGACMESLAQSVAVERYSITFQLSNFGFNKVEGKIGGLEGKISFDPEKSDNEDFNISLDPKRIDTGNRQRDAHLIKEDFFHVDKYPKIYFQSDTVFKDGEHWLAVGKISIKGVEQSIRLPFYAESSLGQLTLKSTFAIDRTDFNVGEGYGGFAIGKEVEISIVCVLRIP